MSTVRKIGYLAVLASLLGTGYLTREKIETTYLKVHNKAVDETVEGVDAFTDCMIERE